MLDDGDALLPPWCAPSSGGAAGAQTGRLAQGRGPGDDGTDHGGEALGWERRTAIHAQATLWQAGRVVAERDGAAALAALRAGPYQPRPAGRVGVLVSGANTTVVAVSDGRGPG